MGNMAYCRFQNTLKDLRDCNVHLEDDLSLDEHEAREMLVELCRDIVSDADDGLIPEFDMTDEEGEDIEDESDSED